MLKPPDWPSETHSLPGSVTAMLQDRSSIAYSLARLSSARTDLRRLSVRELAPRQVATQAQSSLQGNETCHSIERAARRRRSESRRNLCLRTSCSQSVRRCSVCRETPERKSPSTQTRDAGQAKRRRALLTPAIAARDLPQTSGTNPSD